MKNQCTVGLNRSHTVQKTYGSRLPSACQLGHAYIYNHHVALRIPTWKFVGLPPLHQFYNSASESSYQSWHLARPTWFDDTVRGVFFLRISSIRTVRNACSTDCHHTLLRGAVRFFFFDNPAVRCGAVWLEAKSLNCTEPHRTLRKKRTVKSLAPIFLSLFRVPTSVR